VVWPFGAFEQHGPQLPLGTDALFADMVLDAVLARLGPERPIWRLPVQSFGFSPEHQGFPGTLTLPAELLIGQLVCLGAQLAALGFERLLLFNGHGGQIALLQVAARQLQQSDPYCRAFSGAAPGAWGSCCRSLSSARGCTPVWPKPA
jgi:creatinine amidohydrolase